MSRVVYFNDVNTEDETKEEKTYVGEMSKEEINMMIQIGLIPASIWTTHSKS